MELSQVLASRLPAAPLDVHLMTHWLAVEGVQPAIPANPAPHQPAVAPKAGAAAAGGEAEHGASVQPVVKQLISKELQQYYEKISEIVLGGDNEANSALLRAALSSLGSDTGLHPLTPLLVQFVADEVTRGLGDVGILSALMRVCHALLTNASLHIEAYLHQLMPSVLTCLVGKRLGVPKASAGASAAGSAGPPGGPSPRNSSVDHWQLREYAASVAALVCRRFGGTYTNLQPRVTRTLLRALMDPAKPLTTHFGAIVGLAALGPTVTQLLLLPNLNVYLEFLDAEAAKAEAAGDEARAHEAGRCRGAAVAAVGSFFRAVRKEADSGPAAGTAAEREVGAKSKGSPTVFSGEDGRVRVRLPGADVAGFPPAAAWAGSCSDTVASEDPEVARQMSSLSAWLADGLRPAVPAPELDLFL